MNEDEFILSIDAKFPYEDVEACKELIQKGASISESASFMVLHEICRVPYGTMVNHTELIRLVDTWLGKNSNPVSGLVAAIGKKMLLGIEIPVSDALFAMEKIRPHKGLVGALSIPYFACNDTEGKADALYQEIEKEWRVS